VTHEPGTESHSPTSILADVAGALAHTDDLDAGLGRLLTIAGTSVGAPVGAVYLQDPDRAGLQLAVTIGLDATHRGSVEDALDAEGDAVGAVARDRVTIVATNGAFVTAAGVAAASIRPLLIARGGVELPLGVLAMGWDEPHDETAADVAVLDAVAALCAVAIDRNRLATMVAERSEWFERMAHTDPLTGLANQRTFARVLELELARAGRQGSEVSVAIFDVDDFAAMNAEQGHQTGDDILRSVASVLAESVRLVDTVARYGGDEFVVIAPGAAGALVARRVLDGIAALGPVGGHPITVSAGIARFPTDGTTADDLLAAASGALGRARTSGGGTMEIAAIEAG
jgi:diguanylate cyclase (GGDEF)-like protein